MSLPSHERIAADLPRSLPSTNLCNARGYLLFVADASGTGYWGLRILTRPYGGKSSSTVAPWQKRIKGMVARDFAPANYTYTIEISHGCCDNLFIYMYSLHADKHSRSIPNQDNSFSFSFSFIYGFFSGLFTFSSSPA